MAGKNVTIGNVNISMSANAAQLIQEAKRAEKTFNKRIKSMLKTTDKLSKSMLNSSKQIAKFSSVLGGAGVASIAALAVQTYNAQREMQRMSDVAGVSLDTFTSMSHITNSLGLETEYLADAMKDLNVRIVDAAKGGGTMVDFFALMGENAADWIDLAPEKQLDKFIQLTSKLSDNEAKFWADEVNDSMYRLSVTLNRSGKSVQDFMKEADSLGAGTSALFIGQINDMYEAASRLSLLFNEFKGTTFGILAESFSEAFDGMTARLKTFIGEGDNTSENIYNMSKEIALYVLQSLDTMYKGINAFITKTKLLLSEFDSSYAAGLMSQENIRKLEDINERIEIMQDTIDDGAKHSVWERLFGEDAVPKQYVELWEKRLGELVKERDAILSGTDGDAVTSTLTKLMDNIKAQTYELAKAKQDAVSGVGASSNTSDGGKVREALELIKSMNAESTKAEDSQIRQIENDKTKLEYLLKHYEAIQAQVGSNATLEGNQSQALAALESLSIAQDKLKQEQHIKELNDRANLLGELGILEFEQLDARMEAQRAQTALMHEEGKLSAMEYEAALTQIKTDGEEQRNQIALEQATKQTQLYKGQIDAVASVANSVNNVVSSVMGEHTAAAKAMYLTTQAVAVAQAIINAKLAYANAMANIPAPANAPVAAAALSAGYANAASIGATAIVGQFHNGGEIPRDGTYYMEGGEMVIPKDKVTDYINATGAGGGGDGVTIHSSINMGASLVDEKAMAQALSKQQTTIAALVQKEQKKRPSRNRSRNQ